MKKGTFKKTFLAGALMGTMLITSLFGGCSLSDITGNNVLEGAGSNTVVQETIKEPSTPETPKDTGADLEMEEVQSQGIRLAMYSATTVSEQGYITKSLKATVYPEDAEDRTVDWAVSWKDTSNKANVLEYVTVTPESDGSTNATVTCMKAFEGKIIIKCTSRMNGLYATCTVTFLGLPTSLSVSSNQYLLQDGNSSDYVDLNSANLSPSPWLYKYYEFSVGKTVELDINATNVLSDAVNFKNCNFVCSISSVKEARFYDVKFSSTEEYDKFIKSGKQLQTYLSELSVGFQSGYITSNNRSSVSLTDIADKVITAEVTGDKLVVNVQKSVSGYYGQVETVNELMKKTVLIKDVFAGGVSTAFQPEFVITLTETISGTSCWFVVRINDDGATGGVIIDNYDINF